MSVESLFAQWRVVNQQANDAECRLFEASLLHLRGQGPGPKESDRVIAAQLRAEARVLFARALKAIDEQGSSSSRTINGATGPQPGAASSGAGQNGN